MDGRNIHFQMTATRTKICGITRLEDARAAVTAGADALGFVFYERSPRFVSPQQAAEIINTLPPFVSTVGLFVNADKAYIKAVLGMASLDFIQFHGDEEPEFCCGFDRPYIKAVRVKNGVDLNFMAQQYDSAVALLLDSYSETAYGGTGVSFHWRPVPVTLSMPVILAGGLTVENVKQAIAIVKPYAVDVSSGVEAEAGVKDRHKMTAFMNEVSNAKE